MHEELSQLINIAQNMGVEVRQHAMGGQMGGMCRLGEKQVIFVDLTADVATQVDQMVEALRTLPEIENQFISPALRTRLSSWPEEGKH